MSIHRSFRSANRLEKHRNVLSRQERVEKLESLKKWEEEESSIFGLPKVRNIKAKSKKKAKAEESAETEAQAEAETEPTQTTPTSG